MRLSFPEILFFVVAGIVLVSCSNETSTVPTEAEQTYGADVDATDAIPTPAIAAEADRYVDGRVTVDGRIAGVSEDGCTLHLATDHGPPLQVAAARIDDGACSWQVPTGTAGFTVATGTLRATADTLRLTANGVQVTPLQPSK